MTEPLRAIDVRGFFRRRAYRLLPAYYAAVALIMGFELVPAIRAALVPRDLTWADAVTHLTLTFPLAPGHHALRSTDRCGRSPWRPPSISAFPLLVWLGRRHGIRSVLVLTGAVAVAWWLVTLVGHAPHRGRLAPAARQVPPRPVGAVRARHVCRDAGARHTSPAGRSTRGLGMRARSAGRPLRVCRGAGARAHSSDSARWGWGCSC
ncbi:MAG: hypothetical protein V9F04_18030 [Dermatophilaceae bacterium]